MALDRSDPRFKKLVSEALKSGASAAKVIPAKEVFLDDRARLKCLVPRCSSYGDHLLCPPNLPSVSEFRTILRLYHWAILVQLETDFDSRDKSRKRLDRDVCDRIEAVTESRKWQTRLLRLVGSVEASAFKTGFRFAAGLSGGECCLCADCVGPGGTPCRHPFEARPSMEAMGVDVIKTCSNAGMPVQLSSSRKVKWTGLVLVD